MASLSAIEGSRPALRRREAPWTIDQAPPTSSQWSPGTVRPLRAAFVTAPVKISNAQQAWGLARNFEIGLHPPAKAGLVWGLGLTLPLTLVPAFTLSSGLGHHIVEPFARGVRGSDAEGLLLFGWSREAGDPRAAHVLATHTMHAVPLFARTVWAIAGCARPWAWGGAAVWVTLVAIAFATGLMARPLV